MQLKDILPHLLFTFKDERDLIRAIEELSLKFTQQREKISDYLQDERLTSAYTAFYLTTNMPKLSAVFEWMPADWLEGLKSSVFIDLGAGPGTFSLAFREWVGSPVEVIQIETSAVMREQAKKLWQGLYPQEPLRQSLSGKMDTTKEKFLFFGHSANEMGPDVVRKYIQEIDPDHILFVEPGTKSFFPQMLDIRKALIHQGYHILYPCPRAEECPLRNSESDWCHQYIQVKQDVEVERLSQMAKKDRRLLPLIVHAFSKTFARENPSARLIRVFPETKFSYEWEVCELNHIERYQIMKRGLSKSELKQLEATLAGESVVVEQVEKVLEKSKRVKLKTSMNKSPES